MAISDNITEKANAIHQERINNPTGPHPISDEVQQKAFRAILGGAIDWVHYMNLFAKTPAELARLVPTDDTLMDAEAALAKRQQARAYLVANGVCGMGTTEHLLDNVTVTLD